MCNRGTVELCTVAVQLSVRCCVLCSVGGLWCAAVGISFQDTPESSQGRFGLNASVPYSRASRSYTGRLVDDGHVSISVNVEQEAHFYPGALSLVPRTQQLCIVGVSNRKTMQKRAQNTTVREDIPNKTTEVTPFTGNAPLPPRNKQEVVKSRIFETLRSVRLVA